MDDYTREMMDLKTLVTRTLEKKGVLAKIRAELRSSVFEAIESEDCAHGNEEGFPPALLGNCNDRAKQLHASPSGRLLTALVCEYLEWAELGHTLKVYLPECNLERDFWKAELGEFTSKNDSDSKRSAENGPLLLDVLEGFLKYENLSQTHRAPSSSVAGGIPPLGRPMPSSQSSDRRTGSSAPGYSWGYDSSEISEDVDVTSDALGKIHLNGKARNLTTSWRHGTDGNLGDGTDML